MDQSLNTVARRQIVDSRPHELGGVADRQFPWRKMRPRLAHVGNAIEAVLGSDLAQLPMEEWRALAPAVTAL